MIERFSQFPRFLAERARTVRFGNVPVLLAHPDWDSVCPVVLWMHGRTANKEIDPGRYLRWLRAGIAACAIDLPGHGERAEPARQESAATPGVLLQAVGEVDGVVEHLADREWGGIFDLDRMGIGGMSAGGMVALRRLCDAHTFRCAAVEGTCGWVEGLYFPHEVGAPGVGARASESARPDRALVQQADAMSHLQGFRPLPLLALHSEADRVVPVATQRAFLDALGDHYERAGSTRRLIELRTWPSTGAPEEHSGFGRVSNEAKTAQAEFLVKCLGAEAVGG